MKQERDENRRNGIRLLAVLVLALIVIVGVQSILLYTMYRRTFGPAAEDQKKEKETRMYLAADVVPDTPADPTNAPPAPAPRGITPPPPRTPLLPRSGVFDQFFGRGGTTGQYDPFEEMRRMQEEMDRMFDDAFNRMPATPGAGPGWDRFGFEPDLDLTENGEAYVIRMNLPGADKSNIDVQIEDRVLRVSGKTEQTRRDDGSSVFRMERRSGQFSRAVALPGPVDEEAMTAEYQNGVLTVTVPKADRPQQAHSVLVT